MKKKLSLLMAIAMIATTLIMALSLITLPAFAAGETYFSVAADQAADGVGGAYATLANALAAVKDGGTVAMTANYTASENVTDLAKSWTLDGNGHTWTSTGGNFCVRVGADNRTIKFTDITFDHSAAGECSRLLQQSMKPSCTVILGEGTKLTQSGSGTVVRGIMKQAGTLIVDGAVFEINAPAITTWDAGVSHVVLKSGTVSYGTEASKSFVVANTTWKGNEAGSTVTYSENMLVYVNGETRALNKATDIKVDNAAVTPIIPAEPTYDMTILCGEGQTYTTLDAALNEAIAATGKTNILIQLTGNVTHSTSTHNITTTTPITVKGTYNGTRYKVTVSGSNGIQLLNGANVTFRDVDVDGNDGGCVFRLGSGTSDNVSATLNLYNMNLSATAKWYLINIFSNGTANKLNMNNVNVTGKTTNGAASIANGNGNNGSNSEISIHNCTFAGTEDATALLVQAGTTVSKLHVTNSTHDGGEFKCNKAPMTTKIETVGGKQVNTVTFNAANATDFANAVSAENKLTVDSVVFEINADMTLTAQAFKSNKVTVDGNGHTITANTGHTFAAEGASTSLILKNMTVNKNGSQAVTRTKAVKGSLELYNVTINSTTNQPTINMLGTDVDGAGKPGTTAENKFEFTLIIDGCTINESSDIAISFGNGNEGANTANWKTVKATIKNSTITANGKRAIDISNSNLASELTITNSTITSSNAAGAITNAGADSVITINGGAYNGTLAIPATLTGTIGGNLTINDGATIKAEDLAVSGNFTMNGGSLNNPDTAGGWQAALLVKANASATIAGGTIESGNCPLQIEAGATVTMTGGTVKTRAANNAAAVDGSLVMSGGEIKSTGSRAIAVRDGGSVAISGGHVDSIDLDGKNTALTMTGGTLGRFKANNASAKVTITGGTINAGNGTAITVVNGDVDISGNTADITGKITVSGGTLDITDVNVTATSGTLLQVTGGTVTLKNSELKLTSTTADMITAIATGSGKIDATNCVFAAPSSSNECSAIRAQGKGTLILRDSTFTSAGTHPTVRVRDAKVEIYNCYIENTNASTNGNGNALADQFAGDGLNLYVEGGTIKANGRHAVYLNQGTSTAEFKDVTVISQQADAFRVDNAKKVTITNCTISSFGNQVSAFREHNNSTAEIRINGGTFYSSYAVIGSWKNGTKLTFGPETVTAYSNEWDANGSWVFRGITAPASYTAYVRAPGGVYPNPSEGAAHNFQVANAECSVVIGGTTYYVYTGAKGGVPTMIDGASVRIEGDDAGIRFTSYISKKTIDAAEAAKQEGTTVEYGTAIFPTALIEAAGLDTFDPLALEAKGYTVAWVKTVEGQTAVKNANDEIVGYTVRGALVGIKEDHLDWQYSAIAYIKYTNADGEVVYTFGNYDKAENSRSVLQIADAALKDLSDTRTGKYIYKVTDGETVKWSPYTAVQRGVLEAYFAE